MLLSPSVRKAVWEQRIMHKGEQNWENPRETEAADRWLHDPLEQINLEVCPPEISCMRTSYFSDRLRQLDFLLLTTNSIRSHTLRLADILKQQECSIFLLGISIIVDRKEILDIEVRPEISDKIPSRKCVVMNTILSQKFSPHKFMSGLQLMREDGKQEVKSFHSVFFFFL